MVTDMKVPLENERLRVQFHDVRVGEIHNLIVELKSRDVDK